MTFNKKILAAAVVAGLFGTAAQAQVYLSGNATNAASNPSTAAVVVADNIKLGASGSTITNVGNALSLEFQFRYSFSDAEVRYARVECGSGIRFRTGNTVISSPAGDATGDSYGAINGLGTSVITFSVTATGAVDPILSTNRFRVTGDRTLRNTSGPVTCTYSLYDTPSQAQAGGTDGRITTVSGTYVTFASPYALTSDPGQAIAEVEADPSYTLFRETATTTTDTGTIGQFSYGTRNDVLGLTQPIGLAGTAVTLANLFDADTALVFSGDFSTASDVFFSLSDDCSTNDRATDDFDDESALLIVDETNAVEHYLCYETNGDDALPVGEYTVSLDPVADAADAYTVTARGPELVGEIVRNGTQLQAPFAQVPAGWLSRVVLTNTGNLDRAYSIEAQTEEGTTATTGSKATGTIKAGTTLVLNVSEIATFTGNPRGTLNVTVAAPNSQIQGLYQIVNGATGSISNETMVRPGTN